MKRLIFPIIILILLMEIGGFLVLKQSRSQQVEEGLVSPVADDIEKSKSLEELVKVKRTTDHYPLNQYFPKELTPKFKDEPEIAGEAYCVIDRGTGELLFAKNLTDELSIASLTKIMTATLVLERADLDVELRVSSVSASLGEATMGLSSGERVNVEELLYGMMLPSGNDAAETLREGLLGGRTSFMVAMNQRAQELGLYDTFFFNPSGLDEETAEVSNYSTCLDLLGLTNFALSNPKFAEIVATYYKDFPYVEGKHKAFYLYNILQLNRSYPGIKGVKPGLSIFAGETLASYAENGGKQIIVILLGTENSRDEVIKFYDFIFAKLGVAVR